MVVATAAGDLAMLGHAVHYALVAGGLVGVAVVLLPSVLHRATAPSGGPWPGCGPPGALATVRPPVADRGARAVVIPVVVVASVAAAGVHAAMVPPHLVDPAAGAFFVVAALAQATWAAWLVVRRPGRLALAGGAVVNAALITVWALSRTVGVPVAGIPAGEPVGAWDLAAVGWEAVVVVGCVAALRRPQTGATAWHPAAVTWLLGCVLLLGALSMSRP